MKGAYLRYAPFCLSNLSGTYWSDMCMLTVTAALVYGLQIVFLPHESAQITTGI